MHFTRVALLFLLALILSTSLAAQQSSSASTQGLLLLQRSSVALNGAISVNDVTLTGTARRIAGSNDETGAAVLKASTSGASRMDLTLPSGQGSEVRNISVNPPAGAWSGQDGKSHAIAYHNLVAEPIWFSPTAAIVPVLSGSNYVVTYVGHETKNFVAVEHVTIHQQLPGATADTSSFQGLTQFDLYLDSTSLLPLAMDFNIHPDGNAARNIPVEILYSGYQVVSGAQVPFHVQRYLNGSLFLDLQVSTASLNSGLSASTFVIQ